MNKKQQKRLREFLRRHNEISKHWCACGCGKQIIATERHYKNKFKIPKFLPGHNPKQVAGKKNSTKTKETWNKLSEEEKQKVLDRLTPFEKGEDNPNYKGGKYTDSSGYIRILVENHPFSQDGYVLQHRYNMENYLRENDPDNENLINIDGELFLRPESPVHHLNEVKSDNRLENLYVFYNTAEHTYWHNSEATPAEKLKIIESGKFRK